MHDYYYSKNYSSGKNNSSDRLQRRGITIEAPTLFFIPLITPPQSSTASKP